ncbi:MAG: hypothetical protein GTN69_08685 [Armatimonadetes bacterium]|nr:hypothetical protein [Armatimonadota bacterium]NIO75940.1 hypothetical protein [Armatimonadota bacterium]NIO98752.1 hypothetical protein [Armatimonadota bacterium]
MRRVAAGSLVVGLLVVFLAIGCSRQVQQEPADRDPEQASRLGLPEWAPENPSLEFLRAAKVLKPLPEEILSYTMLLPACYELFGTLTDEQIADFLQPKQRSISVEAAARNEGMRDLLEKKRGAQVVGDELVYKVNEISLPVESLTPPQRAAFENVLVAWEKEHVGTPEEDLLVLLYKQGAKEDLSNVTIHFGVFGHVVSLGYGVRISEKAGWGGGICEFAQL